MRARSSFATLLAAAGMTLFAVVSVGCFSLREPPCAFSCAEPPHACPAQYTCLDDGLCHRAGSVAACGLTPPGDAAVDAGADVAEASTDSSADVEVDVGSADSGDATDAD